VNEEALAHWGGGAVVPKTNIQTSKKQTHLKINKISEEIIVFIFYLENRGSRLLRNVRTSLLQ